MNARATPAMFVLVLVFGCGAQREIGSDCPAGGCDLSVHDAAAAACGAEFVVPSTNALASEELHHCQLFTLDALRPAVADRVYITKAVASMTPYTHEIDVRIAPAVAGVADGPVDCDSLLGRPLDWVPLIESLGGSEEWDFTSAPLVTAGSQRLLIAERFANLASDPVAVGVTLRLECATARPARPSQVFEFVDSAARVVMPAEQVTLSGSCTFDHEVELWRLYRSPELISSFSVWRGGQMQPLWRGNAQWSIDLGPPLHMSAGEGLEWECDYENRSDVSFAIGGDSGYSCALMGIYQLARDGEDTEPLRCMQ